MTTTEQYAGLAKLRLGKPAVTRPLTGIGPLYGADRGDGLTRAPKTITFIYPVPTTFHAVGVSVCPGWTVC
jgi:hypothetical protein